MPVITRGLRRSIAVVLVAGAAVIAARQPVDGAENADESAGRASYATVFGERERAVASTSSTGDDAQFAAELLKAAGSLRDDPALVRAIYEKAFEYGSRDADGYATAVAVAQKLRDLVAGTATSGSEWDSKLTDLHRSQYRRAKGQQKREAGSVLLAALCRDADAAAAAHRYAHAIESYKEAQGVATALRAPEAGEIKEKIKRATDRRSVLDRIEKLKPQAAGDPAKADAVATGYLLELDDPSSAAEFAIQGTNDLAREMIPLAVKSIDKLQESELLRLAEWYVKLAAPDTPAARRYVALSRAESYVQKFLEMHKSQDADRLQAVTRLETISKDLLALAGSMGEYTADRIVVWNQHNSTMKDRGTDTVNVILMSRGDAVWSKRGIKLPWAPGSDTNVNIPLPRVLFDTARIEVVSWHLSGGGLAEIEVFRGSRNLARGAKVSASGSYNPGFCLPATLTDGVTTSQKQFLGYWVLPDKTPGWAAVPIDGK